MTCLRGSRRARRSSTHIAVCDTTAAPTIILWLPLRCSSGFSGNKGCCRRLLRRRLQPISGLSSESFVHGVELLAARGSDPHLYTAEARFDDLQPNGALLIRRTKFGKSRLVPLHPTVTDVLDRYLDRRRKLAVTDDHVFLSAGNRRIAASMVHYTFRRVVRLAGVAAARTRPCRIHDLRHTFATRSLQACSTRRESVSRHFVSLATYMGHTDIVHTYWYLEATPELMTDIATAAEALVAKGDA
jgi:integrase/recombinase XerD